MPVRHPNGLLLSLSPGQSQARWVLVAGIPPNVASLLHPPRSLWEAGMERSNSQYLGC